jgi:uncharacterized protein DUF6444
VADGPDLVAENARLRAANAKQREIIDRQATELDPANGRIEVLEERLEAAMVQVAELTRQVGEFKARLSQNASNSSIPPSAEGLGKKPAQPRQRGARKPGKQPGAEGRHLAQTATPDEVVIPLVTAANPDPATLAAVERELLAAFGLPAPAALAESSPTPSRTGEPDETAVLLAGLARSFGVDPSSLRLPPRPSSSEVSTPISGVEAAPLTEAVTPLREPAPVRRPALAKLGGGTVQERLERVEIAIREVQA